MARRPNILFLMSDEHRPDAAGFAGDPVARTPVLDAVAAEGVVFTNAYTPSPICVPGRQSIMAGQFPRTTGCERFGEDLTPGHMTYARRLAQYGYRTVAAGKLHHTGTDQMQGWTHRIGMDSGISHRHIPGRDEASYAGLPEPIHHKWPMAKEVRRAGVGRPPYLAADEYAVDGAVQYAHQHFVDSYYDRPIPEVPLLLKVSLWQPHYPFQVPDRELFDHYLTRVRPYSGQRLSGHPVLGGDRFVVRPGIEVSEREHRRATAAYYGMIELADRMYGRVLDALRLAGQDLDDWIIVYTSDHGEMLGEHGVYEKQRFYEASVRVPLIIRWPARFVPRTVERNVSTCDLFATLCDLAGVPAPGGLDSRSLAGLMSGDEEGWPDEAVSQFGGNRLMIKQGVLKYQWYGAEGPEVLFDLAKDPQESTDHAADPAYAAAMTAFRARRDALGFPSEKSIAP
ncbi:hypothetical protein FE391_15035 [Nonomuraea sp. KC401]|uniref:sulfatase-like hydrolase/transferase n=1 Tax=unclassified Nonomuraea TaxID=2593643 RepID=UPI0010FDA538|nr:sulfatase-like hydrolase/transferase [Nonomuraea sp. KC401]NBE98341.1 sulfatase-like hydrolase/transferase [Nonomuraea sp. K271]TLF73776.1 hypothetical protein FE391_15035 [Nonomuraea sp. KC401]